MRRWLIALVVLALGVGAVWVVRERLLISIGRLVVEETLPKPADLAVILANPPVPAAEEAARLVQNGYVRRVLIFSWRTDTDDILDQLGVAVPKPHEVTVLVLRRMGVRSEAIRILSVVPSGTNGFIRATAQYAHQCGFRSLMVITNRSHTGRTAKLMRGYLGNPSAVIMRALSRDPYHPERWWRDRESARELVAEPLRWLNSFVVGDFWREADGRLSRFPDASCG